MKKGTISTLMDTMLLGALFVPVFLMHAGEVGVDSYGMNTTRVQQMGMGHLDMVMYDDANEVNLHRYDGNVAGLAWDDQNSSFEGNFSYGSGSYTTEYGTRDEWSYMGDASTLYQGLPLLGSMYSLILRGAGLPSPGGRIFVRRDRAVFSLSGGYARESDRSEDDSGDYSSEHLYTSPRVNLSAVGMASNILSYGLSLNYCSLKDKYTSESYGYSYSDEEDYSSIGGNVGFVRSSQGSGKYRTSSGAHVHYSSTGPSGDKLNLISVSGAHIGGFSFGYGKLRAKVGQMSDENNSALIVDAGGSLFFQAPRSPLIFNLGFNRLSFSDENASSSQLTFMMGAGISVPAIYAGFEFINDDFDDWVFDGIQTIKLGGELRSLAPLFVRSGYKKMTIKSYSDIKEDVITAGIGFQIPKNMLSVDFAYNNSRETYIMTFDDTKVTDHIFALSLKKGF
jgi:hypothetical protein